MADSAITTAVFPVAGLGTRFLPITKTGPKEMLPIVDKPVIQYVVQEAIDAGIRHLVFVTSSEKRSIEDYFDRNFPLEVWLERQGKLKSLEIVRDIIPEDIAISYVRQPMPLGLGHAILCARPVVGNQSFAVLLPDDIIDTAEETCLESMIATYHRTKSAVIAVEEVAAEEVGRYGIVAVKDNHQVSAIVEKPTVAEAPSRLAVIGRYILTPAIFDLLALTQKGSGGEIQLTDAIAALLQQEPVFAHHTKGLRFDCGDKLGFIKATLSYAFKKPEMQKPLRDFLQELLVD